MVFARDSLGRELSPTVVKDSRGWHYTTSISAALHKRLFPNRIFWSYNSRQQALALAIKLSKGKDTRHGLTPAELTDLVQAHEFCTVKNQNSWLLLRDCKGNMPRPQPTRQNDYLGIFPLKDKDLRGPDDAVSEDEDSVNTFGAVGVDESE